MSVSQYVSESTPNKQIVDFVFVDFINNIGTAKPSVIDMKLTHMLNHETLHAGRRKEPKTAERGYSRSSTDHNE